MSEYLSDDINKNIAKSEAEGGCWLKDLAVGRVLIVTTQNTVYALRKVGPEEYTISGHARYCPEPTPIAVHGSTWGGSMLKMGFVGRGMRLEGTLNGHTILTSMIVEVEEGMEDEREGV